MRTIDERTASPNDVLLALKEAIFNQLRAAVPGIVERFDSVTQTVCVRPAIREILSIEGVRTEVEIPLLVDVPVVMPHCGGYGLYFAPRPGDECLVIFADLCIDAWWQSGGIQSQADRRRHDLSDAFAVLGCWSQPNRPALPESGVRLQNDEGTAGVSVEGDTVNLFGTVKVNGTIIS